MWIKTPKGDLINLTHVRAFVEGGEYIKTFQAEFANGSTLDVAKKDGKNGYNYEKVKDKVEKAITTTNKLYNLLEEDFSEFDCG